MRQNIGKVVSRGDKLSDLEEKAGTHSYLLSFQSHILCCSKIHFTLSIQIGDSGDPMNTTLIVHVVQLLSAHQKYNVFFQKISYNIMHSTPFFLGMGLFFPPLSLSLSLLALTQLPLYLPSI